MPKDEQRAWIKPLKEGVQYFARVPGRKSIWGSALDRRTAVSIIHNYVGGDVKIEWKGPEQTWIDSSYLEQWVQEVADVWQSTWKSKPNHRYGRDFAAFLGERLLTDFDLRDKEPNA